MYKPMTQDMSTGHANWVTDVQAAFSKCPLCIHASQVALVVKSLPANAGDARDTGSIPGSVRSPGGKDGNPLQYSCLEKPTDWGAWQATAHRVANSQTWLKWLRMHTCFVYPLFNCCWPARKTEVQHDIHCELWTQELNWNGSVYQIYFYEAVHFLLLNILYLIILFTHCSI